MQKINAVESKPSCIGSGDSQGRFRDIHRLDGYPWNAGQGHRQATRSRADIEGLQGATRNATGPLSEPILSL